MEVYCVKEKRHTPNVQGSEKVVITKNNRKLLKVKCASCGITKTRFMPGNYTTSRNCWDTFLSACPLNVGVQDKVTKLQLTTLRGRRGARKGKNCV